MRTVLGCAAHPLVFSVLVVLMTAPAPAAPTFRLHFLGHAIGWETDTVSADGRHLDIDHHQISFAGSRRGVSSRTPRSAAKVEERRPRPERSEGLGNASRNPVRCLAPRPNVARYLGHGEVSAAGSNHLGQSSGDHSA